MINKKRIRTLNPYKSLLPATDGAFVALVGATEAQLRRVGFGESVVDGDTILPNAIGKVSRYNAEGESQKLENAPLETVYHTMMRHWKDWHGTEHSGLVDVRYKKRPRRFIEPPSVELTLLRSPEGEVTLTSPLVEGWKKNEAIFIHTINLFLELFGSCTILDNNKVAVLPVNIQRVNWKILPKGEYPFDRVKQELEPVLMRVKESDRFFVDKRLERLESFGPAYIVAGLSGFSGYIVAAYPDRNLYILESFLYGNATYILDKDWEHVTKLTKAQILNGSYHKTRVIHRRSWFTRMKKLFNDYPVQESNRM